MKRAFGVVLVCVVAAMPALARAQAAPTQTPTPTQTPASQAPASNVVNAWYIGANTGATVVESAGGLFGLEGGLRVWKNLDVVGELSWMQDIATRRQLDSIASVAGFINSGGSTASGTTKVPAFYGGVGVRWVFEEVATFRPYVIATFGGGKYELKPTITLNGTDITSNTAQYGVTLGEDVIGQYKATAATGGIGILVKVRDSWYVDGGLRFTSVDEKDQRANVIRLLIGGGYRF